MLTFKELKVADVPVKLFAAKSPVKTFVLIGSDSATPLTVN